MHILCCSNRHGQCSTNVLLTCNFSGFITYALAGAEGAAHDGYVLERAVSRRDLPMQAGHFYLGDAGYGKDVFLLVPDRGVRYHLREWIDAKARPTNPAELFNLRYSIVSSSLSRVNGSSFVHGSKMCS